jgi:hypothetical protein
MLSVVMLSAIMLSNILLNVFMLIAVILSVIRLRVIMLNFVMLSVVAPQGNLANTRKPKTANSEHLWKLKIHQSAIYLQLFDSGFCEDA